MLVKINKLEKVAIGTAICRRFTTISWVLYSPRGPPLETTLFRFDIEENQFC